MANPRIKSNEQTIPMIRKYIIDPLKKAHNDPNAKPKKVYVVGCSLGAAISQIAYCFILEELFPLLGNPDYKCVDRLISVTAGCPRVGDKKFARLTAERVKALRKLDRAVICLIVYNNDVVPHAPPNILSFVHLDKMVYITKEGGHVMVNPNLSKLFKKFSELKRIYQIIMIKKKKDFDEKTAAVTANLKEKADTYKETAHKYTPGGSSAFSKKSGKKGSERKSTLEEIKEGGEQEKEEVRNEKGAVAAPEEEEEEEDFHKAFEIESANALAPIHDHMVFYYMTYLEKLKTEQDTRYDLHSEQHDSNMEEKAKSTEA